MSSETTCNKRHVGQVKWFNNKAGFGFVTMKHETGVEADIFTHYSTVHVTDSQYKYLVQGEYVEFDLTESTNNKHQFQAANITGINGGNLMCETRQLNRPEKNNHHRKDNRHNNKVDRTIERTRGTDDSDFVKVEGKRTLLKRNGPPKEHITKKTI